MQQAIELLRNVPDTEQDRLARFMLNELTQPPPLSTVHCNGAEEDTLVSGSISATTETLPVEDFSDWEK